MGMAIIPDAGQRRMGIVDMGTVIGNAVARCHEEAESCYARGLWLRWEQWTARGRRIAAWADARGRTRGVVEVHEVGIKIVTDEDADTSYLTQEGREADLAAWRRGDFGYVGMWAYASLTIDGVRQTVTSAGIWGVEDRTPQCVIDEVALEELKDLSGVLDAMGIDGRDATAPEREMYERRTGRLAA